MTTPIATPASTTSVPLNPKALNVLKTLKSDVFYDNGPFGPLEPSLQFFLPAVTQGWHEMYEAFRISRYYASSSAHMRLWRMAATLLGCGPEFDLIEDDYDHYQAVAAAKPSLAANADRVTSLVLDHYIPIGKADHKRQLILAAVLYERLIDARAMAVKAQFARLAGRR